MWRQPPYFFSFAVRGHPRDPLQRKIASFTQTNHDDNERKRIALKYTMLCGCIYGLKCGTVFVGMTVPWKLLPDRRTTKVRASVGPTTILPVRVRGPALILKTGKHRAPLWFTENISPLMWILSIAISIIDLNVHRWFTAKLMYSQ